MTDFTWPSDADRAESDELNRVCEHLEEVLDALDEAEGGLRAVRANRNRLVDKLLGRKQERDAFAAHQADLVRELSACQSVLFSLAHDGKVAPEYAADAKAVLKRTKHVSLARRDAEQQRKGLTMAFDDPVWGHLSGDAKNFISEKIGHLENKAGDENDGY